jgi:DNA mismatch repair protein MutL
MRPEDRSLYNAFVPVYDRVDGTDPKQVTQQKIFDLPVTADDFTDTTATFVSDSQVGNQVNDPGNATVENAEKNKGNESIFDINGINDSKKLAFVNEENKVVSTKVTKNELVADESDSFVPMLDFSKFDSSTKNENNSDNRTQISEENNPKEPEYLFSLSSISDSQSATPVKSIDFSVLGIAFNAYIIVQLEDKLWLIDKHAAHERILFEDMKKIMAKQEGNSQILMLPIESELDGQSLETAVEYEKEIKSIGFDFTVTDRKLVITQIPAQLTAGEAEDMIGEMVSRLTDATGSISSVRAAHFEKALYQASCKAAMKAGRVDDTEHQKWVVERILAIPDIKYCPHGRPVLFELSKSNIEKYFKRL